MGFVEELESEVNGILGAKWTSRDGIKVPEPEDITLANDAVKLTGTVLYADLADSTTLVDSFKAQFAAEVYKGFLICCSRVISHNGGVITAFDGDRVMAVYVGKSKNTSAVKTALQINFCIKKILNPMILKKWNTQYQARHGVGVDTSSLWVAKAGFRGSNDLIWIGRAANYAAKLCSFRKSSFNSWITDAVYNNMHESAIYGGSQKENMWVGHTWGSDDKQAYASNWTWTPN